MDEDISALGEAMLLKNMMMRSFLEILLKRLATDVPTFNIGLFVEQLYIFQEEMPKPQPGDSEDYAAQCRVALAEWGKLIENSESALSAAR